MPRLRQIFYIASEIYEKEHPVRRDSLYLKGGGN